MRHLIALKQRLPGLNHYLLIPILSIIILYPILTVAAFCTDDAAFHLLRLVQLDHLIDQGVWYSRWAPDMAYGYGFPFFNFYAPLAYYAAWLIAQLTSNLDLAFRLTFALGVVASGWASYQLAREHFHPLAALVTAIAYIYAPYQAYDIFFRGNLAESFAWFIIPLALYFMGRLARTADRRWLAGTILSYAAILLTHNVFALIFSPLLAIYALGQLFWHRQHITRQHITAVTLALLWGLALTTFFWLPALLERDLVHSDRLLVPPVFVYWGNYISWYELFIPPQTVYTTILNPSPARSLGLIPLLLALPSLALLRYGTYTQKGEILFFATSTLAYSFLMTATSQPIWDTLPLLEYVQFPWRLLGPAALTLAMLIGGTTHLLITPLPRYTHTPTLILFFTLLTFNNLPWFNARPCPSLTNPTPADIINYEIATATIGTTAKGEYLPRTVDAMPTEPATTPFRSLPDDVTLHHSQHHPHHTTLNLTTPQPFTLTFNSFYYPGWVAAINNQSVPITPATPTGLSQLSIPVGTHLIELRFASTPSRTAANTISALALLSFAALLYLWPSATPLPATTNPSVPITPASATTWSLALTTLLFTLLIHRLEPQSWMFWQRPFPPPQNPVTFTNQMTLHQAQLPTTPLPADQPIPVNLVWTNQQDLDRRYQTTIQLVDDHGQLWSPKDSQRPRRFRGAYHTYDWPPHSYAYDWHEITPLPGTPPGTYTLQLTLFDYDTLQPVPLNNNLTHPLGTIQLTPPTTTPHFQPQYPYTQPNPPDLQLLGYNSDRRQATPGDP
ncbi:MAG TPA: 6-pyruvoyl-tetrahydropterin synthase-related protein, partial [Anaerolineae bacterium]|nr:6-pyruvoyl-tetrahydropterin synthase-related protein [Anaerolineae bacterium]